MTAAYSRSSVPGVLLPGSAVPGTPGIFQVSAAALSASAVMAPYAGPAWPVVSIPGILIPGAAIPGTPSSVSPGAASLALRPVLAVAAVVQPDPWNAYLAATQKADDLWQQWRMMRQAGGTDGTAGFLYGKAYSAQQAADVAYQVFLDAQKLAFPGVRG